MKKTRWNLFLDEHLLEQARELAHRKHLATSEIVRTALEKYLAAVQKAEAARAQAAQEAP